MHDWMSSLLNAKHTEPVHESCHEPSVDVGELPFIPSHLDTTLTYPIACEGLETGSEMDSFSPSSAHTSMDQGNPFSTLVSVSGSNLNLSRPFLTVATRCFALACHLYFNSE
jgi:hypothetical protein